MTSLINGGGGGHSSPNTILFPWVEKYSLTVSLTPGKDDRLWFKDDRLGSKTTVSVAV